MACSTVSCASGVRVTTGVAVWRSSVVVAMDPSLRGGQRSRAARPGPTLRRTRTHRAMPVELTHSGHGCWEVGADPGRADRKRGACLSKATRHRLLQSQCNLCPGGVRSEPRAHTEVGACDSPSVGSFPVSFSSPEWGPGRGSEQHSWRPASPAPPRRSPSTTPPTTPCWAASAGVPPLANPRTSSTTRTRAPCGLRSRRRRISGATRRSTCPTPRPSPTTRRRPTPWSRRTDSSTSTTTATP